MDEQEMQEFIGTKIIKAAPMSLGGYNSHRGWTIPPDEDPERPGHMVVYEDGYVSWSPAEAFKAYRPCNAMNFGLAIEALKLGKKVARAGWNGKDMWVVLMSGMTLPPFTTQGTERKVNDRTAKWIGEDTPLVTLPYIAMWTADKKWLPGWLASQTDMLADDWMIV